MKSPDLLPMREGKSKEQIMNDGYCPECNHPWGYHTEERGCVMPLNAAGVPKSYGEPAKDCACCSREPDQDHDEEPLPVPLLTPEHGPVADMIQRTFKAKDRARGAVAGLTSSSRRAQLKAELAELDAEHAERELVRRIAMWAWNECHDAICPHVIPEGEFCTVHPNPYVSRRPVKEQR